MATFLLNNFTLYEEKNVLQAKNVSKYIEYFILFMDIIVKRGPLCKPKYFVL